jgi:hypothetical protein
MQINFSSILTYQPTRTLIETREEGKTSKASEESRILSYNPYSPYSPSPLKQDGFVSNKFPNSSPPKNPLASYEGPSRNSDVAQTESSTTTMASTSLNRRRKSSYFYIPKPLPSPPTPRQVDTIVISQSEEDCEKNSDFKPIQKTSINVIRGYQNIRHSDSGYTVPSYYNPDAFKSVGSSYQALAGGFQKLDVPQSINVHSHAPEPILPSQINKNQHPSNLFRPSYDATADKNNDYFLGQRQTHHGTSKYYGPTTVSPQHRHFHYHENPIPNPIRIPSTRINFPKPISQQYHSSALPFYKNHRQQGQSHGVLVNDYDPDTIHTGIVIPTGLEHYEIPRYGYLIFNPKRGPPFYIIPAPDLDNLHSTETISNVPQPIYRNSHSSFSR